VALGGGRLWVAARDAAAAHQGGTLRVGDNDIGTFVDQTDYSLAWQLNLTGDGLTAYRRAHGADGATLVPDLAVAIPTPTDGGRTYTFQVRRGVRYSSGETVGAADFRRAIERFYRLGPVPVPYYDAIAGAAACRRRPAACDLSRGIVTDPQANTVTFRLTRPDPNLLHALALPFAHAVAPSAPRDEVTGHGLPATGPYVLASRTSRELRFVRNPEFREWSRAARPDGYPDEIVVNTSDTDGTATAQAIENDRLDLAYLESSDAPLLQRLGLRYPRRLRTAPVVGTYTVTLNTQRPPFDRPEARRAVAYAVDRRALARLGGQPQDADVACQILPPNFPAHRRYCPFTRDPGSDGAWRAPDFPRARRLVERSGTAGAEVVVRTWEHFAAEARYVASLLRDLGYRARVGSVTSEEWLAAAYPPDRKATVQVGLNGWIVDYLGPSTFFDQLRCTASDPARFCDPAIDRQMDRALAVQASDPQAADRLWTGIDRQLTDQAAWIAYATPRRVAFTSDRVGNYEFHPVWHALLDQMWVR
jgi:peptide/nickel transport system substrate-binding protein